MTTAAPAPTSEAPARNAAFDALFDGRLFSILSWTQLDDFWHKLDPGAGWYLYALGQERPRVPAEAEQVKAFVQRIDRLLRQEHPEDYCGIVYTDDVDHPRMIKVYDPHNLGSICGTMGKQRVLPGWVISRVPPSDLVPSHPVPQNRQRWWRQFMDLFDGGK